MNAGMGLYQFAVEYAGRGKISRIVLKAPDGREVARIAPGGKGGRWEGHYLKDGAWQLAARDAARDKVVTRMVTACIEGGVIPKLARVAMPAF